MVCKAEASEKMPDPLVVHEKALVTTEAVPAKGIDVMLLQRVVSWEVCMVSAAIMFL